MSVLKKITGSLSGLSNTFALNPLAAGYSTGLCKKCGRETRWIVHLGRGYFRCAECNDTPGEEQREKMHATG